MAIIIKNAKQIEGIRKSSQLAAQALDFITPHVVTGISTLALNALLAQFISDNGAIAAPLNYGPFERPYPRETCISLNEVICHGIPNDKDILKNGDILNIDVTTILDGYFGDTSRMYTVGTPSKKALRLIEVTRKALEIGIAMVWPGNDLNAIGYEITQYANQMGYGIVDQFCGHGVGIRFHEPPQVNHHCQTRFGGVILKPGMIFTIEPMLNIGTKNHILENDQWTVKTADGQLSAQYEHTILVTETGHEILTERH